MKLCVRTGWESCVGPRHPGMSGGVGIRELGTLGQKGVRLAQGLLHRPVHSKTQLPLSTPDVESPVLPLNPIENRYYLNRSVRNGETDFNASPDIEVSR